MFEGVHGDDEVVACVGDGEWFHEVGDDCWVHCGVDVE